MKQYCRYCAHLCAGNGVWCAAKNTELRESTAKSVNKCKDFEFCEIDAFGETDGYKPRRPRWPASEENGKNQFRMEGV